MNTKKLLVSFMTIACILAVVATVSAGIASNYSVEVDGMDAYSENISVVAGELLKVEVTFVAENADTDVTLEAELEGDKVDVDAISQPFDVLENKTYRKTLTLRVPYELKDEVSDELTLDLELDGEDHKTVLEPITLSVQRPSYNADIKSVVTPQAVDAGETFPVDIVIKNRGYNDLDDLYVTATISALGVEKTSYFGDLVALECSESEEDEGLCDDADDEDTVSGRLYLEVPFGVEAGVYTLEVTVENSDTVNSDVAQIVVENDLSENVIVAGASKTAAAGEDAEYSLLIVNPTDKLKVYRVVPESASGLSTSTSDAVVAVPAGSSKTVRVTANADTEGEYSFSVNVLSGEQLVGTAALDLSVAGKSVTDPVVVLTVILAIIFIVLLIVLIVLIGKKPEKAEEFGESYY